MLRGRMRVWWHKSSEIYSHVKGSFIYAETHLSNDLGLLIALQDSFIPLPLSFNYDH